MFKGGDGRKPKRGANSIELVYLQDPGVLEKYSFHHKWWITNPNISRNEKYSTFKTWNIITNPKTKPWAIQLNQKMLHYKDTCYSWTELHTNNSKIGLWGRGWLSVQFKYLFSFFLGISSTIPSWYIIIFLSYFSTGLNVVAKNRRN